MKSHTELAIWSAAFGAYMVFGLHDLRDDRWVDFGIDVFMILLLGVITTAQWCVIDKETPC